MTNPGYTRRQELTCTLAELETYAGVVLYNGEVLYVKQADDTYDVKIGDGTTPVGELPYVVRYTDIQNARIAAENAKTAAEIAKTAAEVASEDIMHLADAHTVTVAAKGQVFYNYNFKIGHNYRVVNNTNGQLVVRIRDASSTNTKMRDSRGTESLDWSLTNAGSNKTFTPVSDAVTLYLYCYGTGSAYLEDVGSRIYELEEAVAPLDGNHDLPEIQWVRGSIGKNGVDATGNNHIRTGFIPVNGIKNVLRYEGRGTFVVFEYASNAAHSNLISRQTEIDSGTWFAGDYYIKDNACKYIRIVAKKQGEGAFTTENDIADFTSYFSLQQPYFAHKTAGRYVSPVKEEFHYDGPLTKYSRTGENGKGKLDTLYGYWDDLMAQHTDIITKTRLGTVDGKEIRAYTITPTPLRQNYTVAQNSCQPLKILYVSSVHGGERAISIDDFTLFKNLVENHEPRLLWNNCVFVVIPAANPVGYDAHTRNNGNDVNINRNFPANWTPATDAYNKSGDAPGDQYETQVLMNFVKSHPDAFLVINRHGTDDWKGTYTKDDGTSVASGPLGYASSVYQADIETIIGSHISTDTMLRDMETYSDLVQAVRPDLRIYEANHSNEFNGSFDRWFTSLGYHGYLFEYADRFLQTYLDNHGTDFNFAAMNGGKGPNCEDYTDPTLRRMNISAIANLLCDSVLNNREIIGNHNKLPG